MYFFWTLSLHRGFSSQTISNKAREEKAFTKLQTFSQERVVEYIWCFSSCKEKTQRFEHSWILEKNMYAFWKMFWPFLRKEYADDFSNNNGYSFDGLFSFLLAPLFICILPFVLKWTLWIFFKQLLWSTCKDAKLFRVLKSAQVLRAILYQYLLPKALRTENKQNSWNQVSKHVNSLNSIAFHASHLSY